MVELPLTVHRYHYYERREHIKRGSMCCVAARCLLCLSVDLEITRRKNICWNMGSCCFKANEHGTENGFCTRPLFITHCSHTLLTWQYKLTHKIVTKSKISSLYVALI